MNQEVKPSECYLHYLSYGLTADQKGRKACETGQKHDNFTNENEYTFFWLVNRVQILVSESMIFEAEPAKLMATWTCHMRTTANSLNGNLTFWTFISYQYKIDKAQYRF